MRKVHTKRFDKQVLFTAAFGESFYVLRRRIRGRKADLFVGRAECLQCCRVRTGSFGRNVGGSGMSGLWLNFG
jgi:hypothetical protein